MSLLSIIYVLDQSVMDQPLTLPCRNAIDIEARNFVWGSFCQTSLSVLSFHYPHPSTYHFKSIQHYLLERPFRCVPPANWNIPILPEQTKNRKRLSWFLCVHNRKFHNFVHRKNMNIILLLYHHFFCSPSFGLAGYLNATIKQKKNGYLLLYSTINSKIFGSIIHASAMGEMFLHYAIASRGNW